MKRLVLIKVIEILAYIVMALGVASFVVSPSLTEFAVSAAALALVCIIDERNGWGIWAKEYDVFDYKKERR